jgi:signal peptidase II
MSADATRRTAIPVASLLLTAGTVAVDQITKFLVVSRIEAGEHWTVIEGWFHIRLITNPGGLFGSFRNLPETWRVVLFSMVPLLASVALLVFLLRAAPAQRMLRAGLALILGGALGNLAGRMRLGYVIDFLDVFWRDHHWPAFNVADASICVGVGLILLDAFVGPEAGRRTADVAEDVPPSTDRREAD